MKNQAFNPYLPSWEYIPDGEPHVFGDRVYVYGSHDAFGAPIFCVNDYVCWSAPVSDLSDWRCEGVIYRKRQDPGNPFGIRSLYAPDVTQGPDGRYYLYYAFDFLGEIGVAVCDTPAGQYTFYGKVHHKNGKVWGKKSGEQFPFDPGVLTDDDGRVWLYSGFAVKVPFPASRWHDLRNDGGVVMELESDMVTIRTEPRVLFPTKGKDGAFPHAFFEASSIRKVDGKYCFVYSSEHNHDLCWAMSDRPDGGFRYGGVLVDLGDLYLDGKTDEGHANNYLGNTHGGLLQIGSDWYIFYHRQTNGAKAGMKRALPAISGRRGMRPGAWMVLLRTSAWRSTRILPSPGRTGKGTATSISPISGTVPAPGSSISTSGAAAESQRMSAARRTASWPCPWTRRAGRKSARSGSACGEKHRRRKHPAGYRTACMRCTLLSGERVSWIFSALN